MNILCINYEYPPIGGGGGVVCQGLSRNLTAMGHHIDIITSGMNGLPAYERENNMEIHRVKCIRHHRHYVGTPEMLTQVIPTYIKARELMSKKKYDLNHTHFIIPSGLVAYLLWKAKGLPYVITAHGSDVPGYNPDRFIWAHKMIHGLWSCIVRNSLMITTPSLFLKNLFPANTLSNVEVIPNGFDFFTSPTGLGHKKNRIILVTRMFERKGIQFFLRAIAGFKTDWEILIAGDGPYLSFLKKEAVRCSAPVKFVGYLQGQELIDLYQSAKIFVFPSVQENFPIVLLEAMNAGCAVITTKAPGCVEVVGDAAIQIEPRNVEHLRESLMELMHDERAMQAFSALSLKRAAGFSWPRIAQRFNTLFKVLIAKSTQEYEEYMICSEQQTKRST